MVKLRQLNKLLIIQVSSTFPFGSFNEDYGFNSSNGDLDICNGRWTITPDYPNGTYEYFVATVSSGNPVYPFIIGPYFYGNILNTRGLTEAIYTSFSYVNSTAFSGIRINNARLDRIFQITPTVSFLLYFIID